ncbi:hypothetical protein BJX61DRAFT_541164 [Aspergillus egyptiacus]|nr:hypothetical protein BJX61DRAFT_541164 [Aspergillus egyptiacus]
MAAAPLESSSTPPDATSTDTTRPPSDLMEDTDPHSTRKRPRLDSGSGICETLSAPNETSASASQPAPDAPAALDQGAPVPNRPASRMTINMKSPTTADNPPSSPEGTPSEEPNTEASAHHSSEQAPNVVSLSSSPTQSPEIEVAELEDMDQDPNTTSWKSLGEALRDPAMPDVVQFREPVYLPDTFPSLDQDREPRENLEDMCVIIEKGMSRARSCFDSPSDYGLRHPSGSEHDALIFTAVKQWLDDVVNSLDQLTFQTYLDSRYFWDEVPILTESLLRRTDDFQSDDGPAFWKCLEGFFLSYARLFLHLIRLDTLFLRQISRETTDLQGLELISRNYFPPIAWSLTLEKIPFYNAMQRRYGNEVSDMVARHTDRIIALDGAHYLSEFASCITSLIPRCPQFSPTLVSVLNIAHLLAESGNGRHGHGVNNHGLEASEHQRAMNTIYGLIRCVDQQYQAHITKKSSWLTKETSDPIIRQLSVTYLALCNHNPDFASRIARDLLPDIPEDISARVLPSVVYHGWRFGILRKQIMEGRMELRVLGVDRMQRDFVEVFHEYMKDPAAGVDHPVVQYLLKLLRESRMVEYIVGVESHPQLIYRSHNIVGFLVITSTYTDQDTDTIWKTVTESPDPRVVSEVLGMLGRTFSLHALNPHALLYLCSKLLELPLTRFDPRMVEFCDQLFHYLRERHSSKQEPLNASSVDVRPLRLCVRLIRESAATEDLAVDHKAHLQRFAASQLSLLMDAGLSDVDKMDIYERCIQDIADKNQFTVGSIQALNALINQDSQEIRKLATEFNLTLLIVSELAGVVEGNQTDFTDPFSCSGFHTRVRMLARIIDGVPDSITPELGEELWQKVFMSRTLTPPGKRALWEMICHLTRQTMKENPFIDHCIQTYLPRLSPLTDYSPEVLAFAKQAINYQIRFNPPPNVNDNEVISIPGMDLIWTFILTALPNSIEADATAFAIEVYLDHNIIHRSPRSAVEATHMALVDRCVDQLKSAASNLKTHSRDSPNIGGGLSAAGNVAEVSADELRFSRSLFFLRQFLQALRARPQYSPPQNSPPNLPTQPLKGEMIDLRYQAFDGGSSSKLRTLRIGDLSTGSELLEALIKVTGFPKIMTIYSGHKIDLSEKHDQTLRDLKLGSGLLIVRRDPNCRGIPGRKLQRLTSVDTEVLKHFDDLYDLLNLDDYLAREIYEFLVVFPPQEKVMDLVKSVDRDDANMFQMNRPYNFLYSVNALSECLREEALEPSPSEPFVSHSIRAVVAALTRPEISDSLATSPKHILLAANLVECLLYALLVKLPVPDRLPSIPDATVLVVQLLRILEIGQNLSSSPFPEINMQKLVCYTFAVLIEGSVRDPDFWSAIKQQVKFDKLVFSLLIQESCQPIRRGIADNITLVCSPSKQLRKPKLPAQEAQETREAAIFENPATVDILATIWDGFVLAFPRAVDFPAHSQEFFETAYAVFCSVAERSPRDLVFNDYLKQWSGIMLRHRTNEFVGREPVDHIILGFSRLLKSCLEIAASSNITLDTFTLTEQLFDTYLFPDLSMPSSDLLTPQVPVMHSQTRQELYALTGLLAKYDDNYAQLMGRLEDIIPLDHTYQPVWPFDRQKLIRSPEGYAGLRNLSNTCYLNSLISQLFMNVGFREFMLGLNITDPFSSQKLLNETKKVFGYMQDSWLKSVDPQDFVDTIRTYDNEPVDVNIQMDVDEFYNLLFDRWEAQITNPEDKKRFRSFYGGQLVQQIKSKECSHISERLEPFSAIQCDIKGKASLEESLQAYVEGEIMQGDNKYSCTSCERHVDAVKRACLKDVPDNLIFHLKRFDFDMVSMMRNKINDEFQFPERINMAPFTVQYLSDTNEEVQDDVFELVGVLVHSGTAESGHYYSYIRERPAPDGRGGTWVEFNDSDVSRFDPGRIGEQCFGGYSETVHSASVGQVRFNKVWNAYMLFYQRVSSMDAARSTYHTRDNYYPVRVPLPLPLANHITMENELFVRVYCLLDPYYAVFVRFLFAQLNERRIVQTERSPKLDKSMIWIALDTLEQLVSRTKEANGFDALVGEIYRSMNESPKAPYRVIQWAMERSAGVPHLVKSPYAQVRTVATGLFVHALSKLRENCNEAEDGTLEHEKWNARYLDGLEHIIATLESMWPTMHTAPRSWDDYFGFLSSLASLGEQEAGIVLEHGFLLKCLEMVWLDYHDLKRLKRQYVAYFKLMEKGRKFSHRKLMDFMAILLSRIDLTVRPTSDDERQVLTNGKFALTITENDFIRPLGANGELVFLTKILQQHSSPQACRNVVGLLMDAEPELGLMGSIHRTLEEGLRYAPAELCAPFLDATLTLCRGCPDEERIVSLIDFVAKGVETISNSGGKEHLTFFTSLMTSRNERLGLDEPWFLSHIIELVPDWGPALLMYPERAVRNLTVELLRRILFNEEASGMSEDSPSRHATIAKGLVSASIDKLRKTYLAAPGVSVEARTLEAIRTVIDHCLTSYYDDTEEDQKSVRQAQAVLAAIEELTVEIPEELPSESDIPSPEEWEDNSMMASDSDLGLAGTP